MRMAMIRKYDQWPAFFVPDRGEIVLAARTPAGPFLRVAVLLVRRRASGKARVDFEYLDDSDCTVSGVPIRVGDKGNVYITEDDKVPLIRRLPARPKPCSDPRAGPEQGGDVTDARPPGSADPRPA